MLAISTLSGGKDEIFGPDYLPKTNQFKDSLAQKQVANSPMFEKVPSHLRASGRGRNFTVGGYTKEERV